jgi:hypothetical protein
MIFEMSLSLNDWLCSCTPRGEKGGSFHRSSDLKLYIHSKDVSLEFIQEVAVKYFMGRSELTGVKGGVLNKLKIYIALQERHGEELSSK